MRNDDLEHLRDLFSAFAPVAFKAMFGGHGIYRDGRILGIVVDGVPYLKVDEATRGDFEAAGSAPFAYEARGRVVAMRYWRAPDAALDSPEDFRPWARRAWEAALRAPPPKAKKSATASPRKRPRAR